MAKNRSPDLEARFLALLDRNAGRIARLCHAWTKTGDDFDDLRAEVHLQLWRSLPSFDGRASEDTWLYRVTLNTAMLHSRRTRTRRAVMTDTEMPEPRALEVSAHAKVEKQERWRALRDAVASMPRVERSLITLWLESLSYRQMADITGLSENRIGVTLHRARKKLARRLRPSEVDHG